MIQLKITKKIQKEIGLPESQVYEPRHSESKYGDWFVNKFECDGRKFFIFMNEPSLFSFVMFGVQKQTPENMYGVFIRGLQQILDIEGISERTIRAVISDCSQIVFTKTDSKKSLGNLNDLVNMYQCSIDYDGGLANCDLTELMKSINRSPQRNIGWAYSIDVYKQIISSAVSA